MVPKNCFKDISTDIHIIFAKTTLLMSWNKELKHDYFLTFEVNLPMIIKVTALNHFPMQDKNQRKTPNWQKEMLVLSGQILPCYKL